MLFLSTHGREISHALYSSLRLYLFPPILKLYLISFCYYNNAKNIRSVILMKKLWWIIIWLMHVWIKKNSIHSMHVLIKYNETSFSPCICMNCIFCLWEEALFQLVKKGMCTHFYICKSLHVRYFGFTNVFNIQQYSKGVSTAKLC